MSPRLTRSMLWLALAMILAACSTAPAASFDPTGPCTADGQRAGAYPALESELPMTFDGRPPESVDSGRGCTPEGLGTLANHGIEEIRFAGAIWPIGERSGLTLAIFSAPGLEPANMAEFYESGARSARRTDNISVEAYRHGSASGTRIDALTDETFQSIVVLDGGEQDQVRVALVASDVTESEGRDAHDAVVAAAVETLGQPAAGS